MNATHMDWGGVATYKCRVRLLYWKNFCTLGIAYQYMESCNDMISYGNANMRKTRVWCICFKTNWWCIDLLIRSIGFNFILIIFTHKLLEMIYVLVNPHQKKIMQKITQRNIYSSYPERHCYSWLFGFSTIDESSYFCIVLIGTEVFRALVAYVFIFIFNRDTYMLL